ncbi:glycosyl hydrolase [Roseimarinus sediminis]|uniref:glycosyl hydrolase n=1 Tax=Roseimarinus sediminis TaxID=1610899 RepID=UPI003D1C381B
MRAYLITLIALVLMASCQPETAVSPREVFQSPPESAKPWVFWYWMKAAVSAEGITADLEAMKEAGIGGAYLMPIKGADQTPLIDPPVVQLTPEWWEMVKHAFAEADRLGLKLAMHASDGFALSGGPWITPELSMQQLVWSKTNVSGRQQLIMQLPQPSSRENYYKDIAVYAYPTPDDAAFSTHQIKPVVSASNGENASFLVENQSDQSFRSDDPCWIQYAFEEPFTCRNIKIETNGNNYQAQRLEVQVSDNGKDFRSLGRLNTPRHGWQDTDAAYTYAIEEVSATYFRFVFDPEGTEPGAEDLDAAKWKASLKVAGIHLSGEPVIGGIEGKNATVWRIAEATPKTVIPDEACINPDQLINISEYMDETGNLNWNAPEGNWTIIRMGHTSTGHTNYTGGGGLGLEVDKFNPEAVKFQFDQWFGKIIDTVGEEEAQKVLKIFHVDSWECGSQNWSPVFAAEFEKRRGYSLLPMLPVMAGIPVESAQASERFLKDVRQTILDLTLASFYEVYAVEAHQKGCEFSAECVSPTMTSDGMLHYQNVDIPMGEFWLRSPTHDKPNDMLDAISGGHIYGKQIIKAEGFTELRMAWDEHPGMLKTLGDRSFALGFNKFSIHVFTHNPWMDRKPGMTLDPIGLFFQRNQTWWNHGRAWVDYLTRCQSLLQLGRPVVDIAVFTGEDIPRRSVLPDRLVPVLPGIFGDDVVEAEKIRLKNEGQPRRELPRFVHGSANMADPEDWVDPLNGYAYDSFNPDALLRLAKVENGRIVLPGGASYAMLVIPGKRRMNPNGEYMSGEVASKIEQLINDGATVLFAQKPIPVKGDAEAEKALQNIFNNADQSRVLVGAYNKSTFEPVGIAPDLMAFDETGKRIKGLAWNHRSMPNAEIYFIANQQEHEKIINCSFRTEGKLPEIYNPVTGGTETAKSWAMKDGRTTLALKFPANGSYFVVFEKDTKQHKADEGNNWTDIKQVKAITGNWELNFDPVLGGPAEVVKTDQLKSWTGFDTFGIKHYSGTVAYNNRFEWEKKTDGRVFINLGEVANIAEVFVNDKPCGIAWTAPYRVEISEALRLGNNKLRIEVTNTWANRMIGDHGVPEEERITWTTAPYVLEGKPLLDAGLLSEVNIEVE